MTDYDTGYVKKSNTPSEEVANNGLKLTVFDIWSLGITIAIGGQYFSWNAGFTAGFGSYLISTLLMGTSYICLSFCNAEISSSLPFAGGAYGLARVTLGFYPGFIVGCLEAGKYIIYVATSAIMLSTMTIDLTKSSSIMMPVFCLLFYISAVTIHIIGGKIFWRSTTILGLFSFGILLLYIFGSIPWCNFSRNATSQAVSGSPRKEYFIGGITNFLSATPLAAWFYVGVESLNLASASVDKPKVTIGRASIACSLTLFATSIAVLFVSASLMPSTALNDFDEVIILSSTLNPLSNGFMRMFNISFDAAIAFSIPATYATAFGFIFAFGRVLSAMTKSSLFPAILARTCGQHETPFVAILVGSVIGYILCIVVWFKPFVAKYLFNFSILSGFIGYISQCVGFILFRIHHDSQARLFRSPLGIPGAVYGVCVYSISAVSVMIFQKDENIAVIAVLVCVGIYTVYYFSYAKKRQGFSAEEKFIFVLQIVKFNRRALMRATSGRYMRHKEASQAGSSRSQSQSFCGSESARKKPRQSVALSSSPCDGAGTGFPSTAISVTAIDPYCNSPKWRKLKFMGIHASNPTTDTETTKPKDDCPDLESFFRSEDDAVSDSVNPLEPLQFSDLGHSHAQDVADDSSMNATTAFDMLAHVDPVTSRI